MQALVCMGQSMEAECPFLPKQMLGMFDSMASDFSYLCSRMHGRPTRAGPWKSCLRSLRASLAFTEFLLQRYNFIVPVGEFFCQQYENGKTSNVTENIIYFRLLKQQQQQQQQQQQLQNKQTNKQTKRPF